MISSASTRIPASVGRWGSIICSFLIAPQYNFMLSLTGIGWTENFGTALVQKYSQSAADRGERSALGRAWRAVWEATIDLSPA